jgi:hypothetical protein
MYENKIITSATSPSTNLWALVSGIGPHRGDPMFPVTVYMGQKAWLPPATIPEDERAPLAGLTVVAISGSSGETVKMTFGNLVLWQAPGRG